MASEAASDGKPTPKSSCARQAAAASYLAGDDGCLFFLFFFLNFEVEPF